MNEKILGIKFLFNLTENEFNAYIGLLTYGESKVNNLAKYTGIFRTNLYDVLESLIRKGLINYKKISGIKVFSAVKPSILEDIMSLRQKQIIEAVKEMENIHNQRVESGVEYYEGKRGVLSIFNDILNNGEDFLIYGNYELSNKTIRDLPIKLRDKRLKKGMIAKVLIDPTEENFYRSKIYKKLTEIRFNEKMKEFSTVTFIYGDCVATFTQSEQIIGVIVKNKEINQKERIIFEEFWKKSKEAF